MMLSHAGRPVALAEAAADLIAMVICLTDEEEALRAELAADARPSWPHVAAPNRPPAHWPKGNGVRTRAPWRKAQYLARRTGS